MAVKRTGMTWPSSTSWPSRLLAAVTVRFRPVRFHSRPRCYACPSGREERCERLVVRLDEGRQDNAALKSRVEQLVCQRTQNANQHVMSMGQQANAALMQQQEAFQVFHAQQPITIFFKPTLHGNQYYDIISEVIGVLRGKVPRC